MARNEWGRTEARDVDLGPGGWETTLADMRFVALLMSDLAREEKIKFGRAYRYPRYRLQKKRGITIRQVSPDFDSNQQRNTASLPPEERRYDLGRGAWKFFGFSTISYYKPLGYEKIASYSATELLSSVSPLKEIERVVREWLLDEGSWA